MTYEELKEKYNAIKIKHSKIENDITRIQANRDLKTKELKEQFQITPEQIQSTISEMETEIQQLENALSDDLKKIEDYLNVLSGKVSNATSSSTSTE